LFVFGLVGGKETESAGSPTPILTSPSTIPSFTPSPSPTEAPGVFEVNGVQVRVDSVKTTDVYHRWDGNFVPRDGNTFIVVDVTILSHSGTWVKHNAMHWKAYAVKPNGSKQAKWVTWTNKEGASHPTVEWVFIMNKDTARQDSLQLEGGALIDLAPYFGG
jgi:hypothetical protein